MNKTATGNFRSIPRNFFTKFEAKEKSFMPGVGSYRPNTNL